MKGVLFFVFFLLVGLFFIVLVFKKQSDGLQDLKQGTKEQQMAASQTSGGNSGKQNTAGNRPLNAFLKPPIDTVDKKYSNFFETAVVKQGNLYRWDKSHLTYYIDLTAQRRLSKSKVRRAFETWSRKSKLFTFSEASSPSKADIMIKVATASEKNRMGEAGPDMLLPGQTFQLKGVPISEKIIKHAQVTIAIDYFDLKKTEEYIKTGNDQGFQTLVHELGHVLGLMGHSPTLGDCMYFQADPKGVACDVLTPEVNTLAMIYGRPDLLTRGFYSSRRS